MKPGAENRKKTVMLGVLAAAALGGILYNVFAVFGPSTPPPSVAPLTSAPAPVVKNGTTNRPAPTGSTTSASGGAGAMAGVDAVKLASTSSSLDPTLDQAAMLRTESLVYSGTGRNIFSATYTVAAAAIPRNVPSPRPIVATGPPVPMAPVGPPPPPPIPLKFFGTAQRLRSPRQAFLLSGDDVYLAAEGDIVAKRFKIDQITPYGIRVTDLVTSNTQTLPLQQQ